MFDKFLKSALYSAAGTVSVVNALHLSVLKKMGVLEEMTYDFTEIQGSDESSNLRLDTHKGVQFQFSLNVRADLNGFFDPNDPERFFRWEFVDGSYVTLPGIAENAEVRNGRIKLASYDHLEYAFEFTGKNGQDYIYRGTKKLSIFNPVQSCTSLVGGVFDKESGDQILESITYFGGDNLAAALIPFLKSMRLA